MKKLFLYPYKIASSSAKSLSQSLNCKRVRADGKYKYFTNHLIINWGATTKPNWANNKVKILNHWDKIEISSNKLTSLNALKAGGVRTPEFTSDIEVAKTWIGDEETVICRTKLKGHSGAGIVVAKTEQELVPAPLFTKYVNGKSEFRIHIYNDGVNEPIIFDAAQKRKKIGVDNNSIIRSHDNGYSFCRENLVIPEDVKNQAIKAIKVLGLNFAGVDIRYKEKPKEAYVLEANSSCGAEGTTLERYTNLFTSILNEKKIISIV